MTIAEILAARAALDVAEAAARKVEFKATRDKTSADIKGAWAKGEPFFAVVKAWGTLSFSEDTVVYAPIGSNPTRPRMISVRKLSEMADLLAVYSK